MSFFLGAYAPLAYGFVLFVQGAGEEKGLGEMNHPPPRHSSEHD
jgi:hypothetical protein